MKTKARLARIDKAIDELRGMFIQHQGPTRVECPKCGNVKNICNTVLRPGKTFTACKCNEGIMITVSTGSTIDD